jgi:O-antigen/teichoic acid export membrane protein
MFNQLLRLSKHSIVYGLGAAASQVVGFFLIPLYSRYLTPSDYGVLEIFTATMAIIGVIIPLGVTSGLAMSYYEQENEERRKAALSTAYFFLTATSLCFALILIAVAGTFSSLIFESTQYTFYFRVIFLTVFFDTGVSLTLLTLRVQEKSTNYVAITLARLVISIGLNILFVVALRKGVLGILEAHLATSAVIYLFLIPQLIKKAGLNFSIAKLKGMISFGIPYVPSNLAAWIMTIADRYFLQFLSTSTELGLYSMGYKFGMVIYALVVSPFALAWGPFLWSVAKEKNAKEIYSSVLTYFVLIGMFIALVLSVLSREVLMIVATPPFYSAYEVVPLIALSYVLFGCFSILAVGILLQKKTKHVPLITGAGAVMNLGLNYLLIPRYGMMGAAVATVISYLLLPIGSYFVSRRYYPIKYEWGRVAKIFIAAALVFVGSLFIKNDSTIIAGLFKLLSLLGFPLLLFAFRFFKPEEIQKTKEIFRAAPGYVKRKWANRGLLWKKK